MKLDKQTIRKLTPYVPENHPAKSQYINMVNTMVLGIDKQGTSRPIEDLFYFLQVSKNAGLDPTLKQIYAVYRWNSNQGKEVMSIQTGIDGMRAIAERTGKYGGSDDAVFEYESKVDIKEPDKIYKATVTVYKLNPKTGERMPTTASARWSEYFPGERGGAMWTKMPHVMLSKVAEALALRKAFPVASQIYVTEEMDQAKEKLPEPKGKKGEWFTGKETLHSSGVDVTEAEKIFTKVKKENHENKS